MLSSDNYDPFRSSIRFAAVSIQISCVLTFNSCSCTVPSQSQNPGRPEKRQESDEVADEEPEPGAAHAQARAALGAVRLAADVAVGHSVDPRNSWLLINRMQPLRDFI